MYNLAVMYIGVSLGYGITLTMAAAMGSLIPLLTDAKLQGHKAVPWIIASIVVMVMGVVVLTWAGILRDTVQVKLGKAVAGIRQGRMFYVGLLFTVLNGIGAASLNVAFTHAHPAAAAAESQGA